MLCIPIIGPSLGEAKKQVDQAEKFADLLEFRLDLLRLSDAEIKNLKSKISIPILLSHGKSEVVTDYLDVAEELPPNTGSKIIRSYHHFTETPKDLESLYREYSDGDFVKLATQANSSIDGMRMLLCIKKHPDLIGHCMGERGSFTRILGKVVGAPITFAALDSEHAVAPGQLTADELLSTYHFRQLNRETKIFALLGDPVDHSRSHITHNRVFRELGLNALFVKIQVKPEELYEFLTYARELPFEGFAVTKPLKEEALKFIDHFDGDSASIGAINTIRIKSGAFHGCNTDGIGTLNLLEQHGSVKGKHVVILGAGGAAKAIAYEATRRGAKVTILNRTLDKAKELADRLHCRGLKIADFPDIAKEGYDILINATSASRDPGYDTVVDPGLLLPERIMMDVVNAEYETAFLNEAKKKDCVRITGNEMFLAQAAPQFRFWFNL